MNDHEARLSDSKKLDAACRRSKNLSLLGIACAFTGIALRSEQSMLAGALTCLGLVAYSKLQLKRTENSLRYKFDC